MPGQQQQMMGQQRFIRPANVVQQQPGGQVPGGEPVMMIRQRFPMASDLQQAAQIQQQQNAPIQPNMEGIQQQQQPMKVNEQQVQQQQAAQMLMPPCSSMPQKGPPQQGPPHNQHYGNMHPRQPPSLEEYGNSLKKETIMKIVDIYRRFVTESSRTQDKIALIQHLAK